LFPQSRRVPIKGRIVDENGLADRVPFSLFRFMIFGLLIPSRYHVY
jgi:hypothetical protein